LTEITHWLLVGRFTEQQQITQPHPDSEVLENERSGAVKNWSGFVKAEFVITGVHERQPSESSREYFVRLKDLQRSMRGKQVPPMIAGRRTCRPSRLIPQEPVYHSPDGKRYVAS
jgi:hypothetical protein